MFKWDMKKACGFVNPFAYWGVSLSLCVFHFVLCCVLLCAPHLHCFAFPVCTLDFNPVLRSLCHLDPQMVTIEDDQDGNCEREERVSTSHGGCDDSCAESPQPGLDLSAGAERGQSLHCGSPPTLLPKGTPDEKRPQGFDRRDKRAEGRHTLDCAGDDWETASEGDDNESRTSLPAHESESYEDALTEEQQRQKALVQANSLKAEGNALYAAGKYEEALECYTNALDILPEHASTNETCSMCYSNRAICFLQLKKYEAAMTESSKALELNPTYLKALLRRSQAQENLGHLDEAVADMKKVVDLDPDNKQARDAIRRLEPLAAEKREKLKEEMIGKLKDLGNSVLGRFGMSIDNFKAVQDPNTGSYSISFQR
eukprot:c21897_g1_i1 orf=331-1443(+)